ncbi:MAG TPA: hypothetical protein PK874_10030, partial [Desulfobacteraceae bacterium]|nr:hypothetical protein [Desulfobacteraceae bacterium]HPJ67035.1 hypothetical protein [Desulfobacteraceae bacterium]HPQ27301.1 hypothetical protein [Desulfobacteraceae bacterium]
ALQHPFIAYVFKEFWTPLLFSIASIIATASSSILNVPPVSLFYEERWLPEGRLLFTPDLVVFLRH